MAQPRTSRQARELTILGRLDVPGGAHRPSLDELAAAAGAAKSTVRSDLLRLEAAGQVAAAAPPGGRPRSYRLARGWALTAAGARRIRRPWPAARRAPTRVGRPLLPVRSRIAAGPPLAGDAYTDDYDGQTLQDVLALSDDDYLVEVAGHSMVDEGLQPGDFAIIHPQTADQTRDGDVIVARVRDLGAELAGLTLKRFFRDDGLVRLEPANLHGLDRDGRPYQAQRYDPAEVDVCGKLVGVVRRVNRVSRRRG
jgi:SOS-response transcriptional repressor LexA